MRLKSKKVLDRLPADPLESAATAGLRYVSSNEPGIHRRRAGHGFVYTDASGKVVRNREVLDRIRSLVIPPAWTQVWICTSPRGHLQAVGRDVRGRKQYRYHAQYREVRDQTKFGRMIAFGAALPRIRRRVARDLNLRGLSREKVMAVVVRLLETTFMRIGNEEYAHENDSYGLTTLHDRHVQITGETMRFHFRGKSGQTHELSMTDRRLARIVKQCRDLPGYELFQYKNQAGEISNVDSGGVNQYLREIAKEDFTAKDFRTWAGTILAAQTLVECGECRLKNRLKKTVAGAIKTVAARLGNRPATCRKYYIHPAIIDAYGSGILIPAMQHPVDASRSGLRKEELCVLSLIEQKLPLKKSA